MLRTREGKQSFSDIYHDIYIHINNAMKTEQKSAWSFINPQNDGNQINYIYVLCTYSFRN